MSKKLAIKGHPTRGKEVIELLEMLGGYKDSLLKDEDIYDDNYFYFILAEENNAIDGYPLKYKDKVDEDYVIFTLEEFLKEYPFKVGDKVHIYVQNDDTDGRYDVEVAEISSMRWNRARCKIAYKMKYINREFYKEEIKCKVDDSNKSNKVMGKKLAIKSHPTRGKEVIELLEMMGGVNWMGSLGNTVNRIYYIYESKSISYDDISLKLIDEYEIFTLEEFLEKYPFKVGDKVVYTKFGNNCDDYPITIESMKWTGTTIEYTFNDCVTCLAKDLKMWNGEPDTVISGIYLNSCDYADEVELNLGDYEIEVRDGRTFAVKKKPKYPTTYAECCEVLMGKTNFSEFSLAPIKYSNTTKFDNSVSYDAPHIELFNNLYKIFICRNAYWKMAGEELGLGKPWEPTIQDTIWGITRSKDEVEKYSCHYGKTNLLEFPTEEMRDVFYDNFKDLIEQCKELL